MLYLIGLGLNPPSSITQESLKYLKKSDKIFLDVYTTPIKDYVVKALREFIEKDIILANRSILEDKLEEIVEEARKKDISILIYGDPTIATTHISFIHECIKRGVKYKIVHNASIVNAISGLGLSAYKIGKIATIPIERENYKPESFFDILEENKEINAHTIFLLEATEEEFLSVSKALEILLNIAKKRNKKELFNEDTKILVISRYGSNNQKIVYGKVKDIMKIDFGDPPHTIVVPAKLHFIEKELLKSYILKDVSKK